MPLTIPTSSAGDPHKETMEAFAALVDSTSKLRQSVDGLTAKMKANPGGVAGQNRTAGGGGAGGSRGTGGGLGIAAGAAGPVGIAVAAYGVLAEAAGKAAIAINILGDSSKNVGQKNDALFKTFVPYGDKFLELRDALNGFTDGLHRAKREFAEGKFHQSQAFERQGARLAGESEIGKNRNDERAFAGLRPAAPGGFDRSTLAGEQRFQADERTRPLKDAENRAGALADAAGRAEREGKSRLNTLQADRGRFQGELAEAKKKLKREQAVGNFHGLSGGDGGNRLGIVKAAQNVDLAAGKVSGTELEIQKQSARLKEDGATAAQRESESRKSGIAVQREELAILEAKGDRLRANAGRLGGMNRAERAQGLHAARLVKERGLDKVSPRVRDMAERFAPAFVNKAKEKFGEQTEEHKAARAEGLFGDDKETIKDTDAKAAKVKAEVAVNVTLDEQALAGRIGEVLKLAFGNLIESITAKQKAEFDAFKAGNTIKNALGG